MSNTAIDCVPYISKASVISVRRWLMIGSVVLASGQLAGCGSSQPEPAPLRTALTATVQQASSSDTQITGIVRSLGSYDIAPENPGRLVRLRANIGDRVAQGQILAEFDAEPFRLQASQSRAQMQAANVDLDAARREAKRLEGLVEAGAAARQDLDAARTNVSRAEAQQRATSDQAALNARALAKTQLRAPVAGVITARQGELGAILPAGAPVFSLEGAGEREIVASVSSATAEQLRIGTIVRFNIGGSGGQARLSGLSPRSAGVDAQTARFTIVSGTAAPGAAVEVRLPAGGATNGDLMLPLSAVIADRSGARRVVVVGQDGRTTAEPVQIISVSSAGALVRGRLSPGQRVIATGSELIKAGERVRPLTFTP